MSSVNVRNCIRFYQTAEELDASTLMNYCGEIIASHWVSQKNRAIVLILERWGIRSIDAHRLDRYFVCQK